MDIGIIGAGQIGGTLTRLLTELGHDVRVANSRAPETLAELAAETGATAVWAADAAADADLVIVSIPQKNVPDLAPGIVATRASRRAGDRDEQLLPAAARRADRGDRGRDARERLGRRAARRAGLQGLQRHLVEAPAGERRPARHRGPHRAADRRRRRRRTSRSSSTSSTRSASTRSTAARSPSRGASSPAHRSTAPTSTPRAPRRRWPRPRPSARGLQRRG